MIELKINNVIPLRLHRAVFILPLDVGAVVFMASRPTHSGPSRRAHENDFPEIPAAQQFAEELAQRFDCDVIGRLGRGREDAA